MADIGLDSQALAFVFGTAGVLVILYIVSSVLSSLNKNNSYTWPPWKSQCPDYWTTSKNEDGDTICTMNISNPNGDIKCSNTDYTVNGDPKMVNMSNISKSEKCAWANTCNVTWDMCNT